MWALVLATGAEPAARNAIPAGTVPSSGLTFFTVTPCRVADTRDPDGPYGGPVLQSGSSRLFTIPGRCGIPATARSVFFNVTVVAPTSSGHLTLHPGDLPQPLASTVNFGPGQTRANNALLPLASSGNGTLAVSPFVQGAGQVHAILDVTGYFGESILHGIFVSSTAGSPGGDGSSGDPVNTIGAGIALAVAGGLSNVVIDGGDYVESVTLASGIALRGGFDSGSGWIRDGSPTRIAGGSTAVFGNNVSDVLLESLEVAAVDNGAAGGSSYGVRLVGASNIRIHDSIITAGQGGGGANGSSPGGFAANGGNGLLGMPGCENSGGICSTCMQPQGGLAGSSPCGRPGGAGGLPGLAAVAGSSGDPGAGGTPGGTGTPPLQGNWNTPSTYWGQNGSPGSPGANGAAGGSAYGGGGYTPIPGGGGALGQHGNGGGGGGGGGGGTSNCDSYGGGGGGGGGGGCGGAGAGGGTSGGGSFAVYLWSSSLEIQNCQVRTTGGGGSGGSGGTGQSPGGGGQGAASLANPGAGNLYGMTSQDDGSNGGRGGNGGAGGSGGHGGGGAGGPSIGILVGGGSSLMSSGNVFQLAPAGAGGASSGNPGPAGLAANVHTP